MELSRCVCGSAEDSVEAAQFFRAREGNSTEKLFWSQYLAPEHLTLLNNYLKQLMELHRVAFLAMKHLIVQLWPTELILKVRYID